MMQMFWATQEDSAQEKKCHKHDIIFQTPRHSRHAISKMAISIHKKTPQVLVGVLKTTFSPLEVKIMTSLVHIKYW